MKKRLTGTHIIGVLKKAEAGKKMTDLCNQHSISEATSQKNADIASFNGKLRDECVNERGFVSLRYTSETIEELRQKYNEQRMYSSIDYLTLNQFTDRFLTADAKLVSY